MQHYNKVWKHQTWISNDWDPSTNCMWTSVWCSGFLRRSYCKDTFWFLCWSEIIKHLQLDFDTNLGNNVEPDQELFQGILCILPNKCATTDSSQITHGTRSCLVWILICQFGRVVITPLNIRRSWCAIAVWRGCLCSLQGMCWWRLFFPHQQQRWDDTEYIINKWQYFFYINYALSFCWPAALPDVHIQNTALACFKGWLKL